MVSEEVRMAARRAYEGKYLVKVRSLNSSGNMVQIEGYVTLISPDGGIQLSRGPEHDPAYDFPASNIFGIERARPR